MGGQQRNIGRTQRGGGDTFMRNMQEKMEVIFQKVRAHSGDYYNEQVDQLAKKALINGNGIPAIDKIKK